MKLYNDSIKFFADKVSWIVCIIVMVIVLFSLPAQIAVRYGYIDIRYEKIIYLIFGDNLKDACSEFIFAALGIAFAVKFKIYWLIKRCDRSQMVVEKHQGFVCKLIEKNEELKRVNMSLAIKLVKAEQRWLEKILVKSNNEKVYCVGCKYYSFNNNYLKCAVHPDLQVNCGDFEELEDEFC